MAAIDRVLELKNAGSQVDAALWQEYRSCVQETQNHKGESVWVRKNQGIAQRLKYSGCMALRTNEVPNPFKALELYRQRNAWNAAIVSLKIRLKETACWQRRQAIEASFLSSRLQHVFAP